MRLIPEAGSVSTTSLASSRTMRNAHRTLSSARFFEQIPSFAQSVEDVLGKHLTRVRARVNTGGKPASTGQRGGVHSQHLGLHVAGVLLRGDGHRQMRSWKGGYWKAMGRTCLSGCTARRALR